MNINTNFSVTGLFLVIIVALAGCSESDKGGSSGHFPFANSKQSELSLGGCDERRSGTSASFKFLEPQGKDDASDSIRKYLSDSRITAMSSVTDSLSLTKLSNVHQIEEIYGVFSKSYQDFRKDFPDAALCWSLEQKGDTLITTPKIVVYQLDLFTFTGGAHPNTFRQFTLFDSQTGKEKAAKLLIRDTTLLLTKTEAAFRKLEGLTSTDNLEEKGYFLNEGKFFLPASIAFTRKGILLYYNPYEIAAYVRGAIELEIPYEELQGIVKKDDIL